MKIKSNYILIIILFLISCGDFMGPRSHGDSLGDGNPHPEPTGNSEIIDATSFTGWKYYKITQNSLVYLQDFFGNFGGQSL